MTAPPPASHPFLHSFPTRRSSDLLANLIKGMLKIFHSIDPSIFEKVTLTEASSIVVSRCWNDLNLSTTEAVMLIQLYNWILGKPDRDCVPKSKSEKKFEITNSLQRSLEGLLNYDMMVEFINVIILIIVGTAL